jgi:NAD(P)-dependent dehydrogenase (short-subunit alcohol dehydrogenase family)
MYNFENKIVMVTGAAGNLGTVVAQTFLNYSANLILIDYKKGRLEHLFPQLSNTDHHLLLEGIDVTELDPMRKIVAKSLNKFGRIDILVNTVGGYQAGKNLIDTSLDTLKYMFVLNTQSVFIACQAVLPPMIDSKYGKIINIGARAGLVGKAKMTAYSASKSAVISLTESISSEVKNININVNCVIPGTIDTPENREMMPDANHAKWVKPESLANLILFLASDYARDIHGAAIPVYGNS